ncbi:hypothetical protein Tco_0813737 [Tanacetum coccineum]
MSHHASVWEYLTRGRHYLDEMLSLSNDLQIKDYRNEKIDIRFRRECENMIDELKGIECKDSYDSNLDESTLLVTPLSDFNDDECFDPGCEIDEIDAFLDMDISTDIEKVSDSEGDIIYLESFLINDTIPNLHPEVF